MREHVTDPYVKRAQAEGFRSRAAYKLAEIAIRDQLFAPGMTVVDLGAAPGGWSQIAAQAVAPSGRVIALDVLDMPELAGVTVLRGDFADEATLKALQERLAGKPVDLVLSDMAPNMSGVDQVDQARAMHLAELARDFAQDWLAPGGAFLVKLFHGAGFDDFVRDLRRRYDKVVVRKPAASRARSPEVYALATGLRPGPP